MGERRAVRIHVIDAVDALAAAVLAPRCVACSTVLDHPTRGPVCHACWIEVEALTTALHCPPSGTIERAKAAGRYEGALRHILHAFKYEGRRSLAVRLGGRMRASGSDLLEDADCVVPVPLHPWRRLKRGFNQSADLAACLGLPIVHALWRTRATTSQTGLTALERRHNVRDAFSISPLLLRPRRRLLDGHVVVLVDDVRTTGATLEACAQALTKAGVREVRALTAALAE